MSTINTIQLNNIANHVINPNNGAEPQILPPLPPLPQINQSQNSLLTDEDIDKLIESQMQKPEVEQSKPQQDYTNQYQPQQNSQSQEEEIKIDFDTDAMNKNLNEIIKSTKERINSLNEQQKKISARVNLLEKFIKLDEKELAIEVNKPQPNDQKIRGIRNSLTNQTELFGNTLDILLKFESSIQSWTKTLLDIEKDKVSAYQKIKSVNKEQATTETDITDVMMALNTAIKNNPSSIFSTADNVLSINGYSGKKFNS